MSATAAEKPSPFLCLYCRRAIAYEEIQEDICPYLDSMNSGVCWLRCPCGQNATFFAHLHEDVAHVTQIQIVGVPGPDYEVMAEAKFKVSTPYFGWTLSGDASALWHERGWDFFVYHWIRSRLNDLCATAGFLTAADAQNPDVLNMLSWRISGFGTLPYHEPLGAPLPDAERIELGTSYPNDAGLRSAAKELHHVGRKAYVGKKLDEAWLRTEYPLLLKAVRKFAAYLPAQS